MFDETRSFLESLGLPGNDLNDLPTSQGVFDDGSHFKIEVPTVNSIVASPQFTRHLGASHCIPVQTH